MKTLCITDFANHEGKPLTLFSKEGIQTDLTIVEVESERYSCERWLNGSVVLAGNEDMQLEDDIYNIHFNNETYENLYVSHIGNHEFELILSQKK